MRKTVSLVCVRRFRRLALFRWALCMESNRENRGGNCARTLSALGRSRWGATPSAGSNGSQWEGLCLGSASLSSTSHFGTSARGVEPFFQIATRVLRTSRSPCLLGSYATPSRASPILRGLGCGRAWGIRSGPADDELEAISMKRKEPMRNRLDKPRTGPTRCQGADGGPSEVM